MVGIVLFPLVSIVLVKCTKGLTRKGYVIDGPEFLGKGRRKQRMFFVRTQSFGKSVDFHCGYTKFKEIVPRSSKQEIKCL